MATWNSRGLRGSTFEELINATNDVYIEKGLALVQKIPTPITPIEIDKATRHITLAYFEKDSTVDYIGVVQSIPICFDAKECHKDTFPMQNIHEHQLEHIRRIDKHGGIAFLIIKMNSAYFILGARKIIEFVDNNERKSIPYSYILENGLEIKEGFRPPLDYIKGVDKLIKEMDYEKDK